MSGNLALVEERTQVPDAEEALVPQGRLAKTITRLHELKTKISSVQQYSLVAQMRGLGAPAWLLGFLTSMTLLNPYVSPIITKLAMTTLVVPAAALVLVAVGEFDFTKLTTLVANNAGIVFFTSLAVMGALLVQNVIKVALLARSFFSVSHKQYRTYALAGFFTPMTTVGLWYVLSSLYFLGAKNITLLTIIAFGSAAAGDALRNIDPFNMNGEALAVVANSMSVGLRWGLGILLAIHMAFFALSYHVVHKFLNVTFDWFATKVTKEHFMFFRSVTNDKGEEEWQPTPFGCVTAVALLLLVAFGGVQACTETPEGRQTRLAEEAAEARAATENALRITCVNNVTYATEAGKAFRLTNADNMTSTVQRGGGTVQTEIPNQMGSSYCVKPLTESMLRIGEEFSIGGSYRNELIILDADGYGLSCQKYKNGGYYIDNSGMADFNYNCRKDRIVPRSVQYWLELPEGLPKGVKMPPVKVPALTQ